MHVPLVFAGPGIPKGDTRAFAYLMDIYPTFCELAGVPVPAGLDARSLAPVIAGKSPSVRDLCFTAYKDCQFSVRDQRWKLIRYPLVDVTQLFDLQEDPHEMADLSGKPGSAPRIREMMDLLENEMARYGGSHPLKVANPKPAQWSPPATPR